MLQTLCHILQCWCCCVCGALTAAPSAWGWRRRHPSEEIGLEARRGRTRCEAERVRANAEGLAGYRQVGSASRSSCPWVCSQPGSLPSPSVCRPHRCYCCTPLLLAPQAAAGLNNYQQEQR